MSPPRRADTAVDVEAKRLHLALRAAGAGTYEADLATGRNVWSEEIWALYGIEPGSVEPSTQAWLNTVDPARREALLKEIDEAVAEGTEFEAEWRIQRTDGERWLMCRGSPIFGADGKPERYIGIVFDVTEKKHAEQLVARREDELRAILDTVPVAVSWLDRDLRLRFVNRRHIEFFGAYDDIPGRALADMIDGDAYANALPFLRRALDGETVAFENTTRHPDGSQRRWRIACVPERDASGQVVGVMAALHDITRERTLDAEKAMLQQQLDTLARQRVAQNVVAAVAHEINQPLHAALTYAEVIRRMLDQGYPNATVRDTVDRALGELGQAGAALRKLMTSMRAPELVAAMHEQNLNEVVATAVARFRDELMPDRACVALALGSHPLPVSLNVVAIEKVIASLLRNACTAICGGGRCGKGPLIRVSTRLVDTQAELRVEDSGPGVDPARLPRLFDGDWPQRGTAGLGVGLAIARDLVELHGGRIWHEAPPEGGAAFCIALPLVGES